LTLIAEAMPDSVLEVMAELVIVGKTELDNAELLKIELLEEETTAELSEVVIDDDALLGRE
jgi:hypothetical protein